MLLWWLVTCGNPTVSTWILLKASLNPVHNGKIIITILLGPKKTFQLLPNHPHLCPIFWWLITPLVVSWGKKKLDQLPLCHMFHFSPLWGEMNHNEFPFQMIRLQGTGILGFGFFFMWMEKLLRFKSRNPPQMPSENYQTKHWTRTRHNVWGSTQNIWANFSRPDFLHKIQKVVGGFLLGWFVLPKWRPNCAFLVFFGKPFFEHYINWTTWSLDQKLTPPQKKKKKGKSGKVPSTNVLFFVDLKQAATRCDIIWIMSSSTWLNVKHRWDVGGEIVWVDGGR